MKIVAAPEGRQEVVALLEQAEQEPILIRLDNRDAGVLLSPSDYQRMLDVSNNDLWALSERVSAQAHARGLTEAKLAEILEEIKSEGRL